MPALRAEIYSASYHSTRSPFPDATDVYILGALSGDYFIDAEGPSDAPADAANVVLLIPRPGIGAIFVPAVHGDGPTKMGGWMLHPHQFAMGGRYIGTSDSRLAKLVRKATGEKFYGAVPLHDYSMTAEMLGNASLAAVQTVAQVMAPMTFDEGTRIVSGLVPGDERAPVRHRGRSV